MLDLRTAAAVDESRFPMVEELDFDFLENPDVDVDVVVATGYWNTSSWPRPS